FLDTCNEFWWVSTCVAKGLLRKEIIYSKEMLERFVRPMFMKIIEWYAGTKTGFSVSFGKSGKFMNNYLPGTIHNEILKTYSDHLLENNWHALIAMTEIFGQLAPAVANALNFQYNSEEEKNVTTHLKQLYKEQD
ncbi:MAG: aminoglycoside 6-adenylyltransferase, partial [Chitinophagales bacterium]